MRRICPTKMLSSSRHMRRKCYISRKDCPCALLRSLFSQLKWQCLTKTTWINWWDFLDTSYERVKQGLHLRLEILCLWTYSLTLRTECILTEGNPTQAVQLCKQKIVTKSSTEAELVGLSDTASQAIHTRLFLIAQGYEMGPATTYQDNKSCMALMKRGALITSILFGRENGEVDLNREKLLFLFFPTLRLTWATNEAIWIVFSWVILL